MNNRIFAALALSAISFHALALEVPADGTPVELTLAAATPSAPGMLDDVFVTLPEGVQQLRIVMEGETGGDQDMLVRSGGDFDLDADFFDLFDQADFASIGSGHAEHVTITRASNPPLAAGQWHLLLANWDPTQANISVSAVASSDPTLDRPELVAMYDSQEEADETGFFDPAPYSSPHNPADTVGEARRMAFERALEIASDELQSAGVTSAVPVVIAAKFEDLGGFEDSEDNSVTLAHAGPQRVAWDFPGAYAGSTAYVGALVAKQAGTDLCRLFGSLDCNEPDVVATFNSHEDIGWSYALESVANSRDMVSIAMHEVMHGLGFLSQFALEDDEEGEYEAGDWFTDVPDAFSRNLVHVEGDSETSLAELDGAGRLAAATAVDGLRWTGANVAASPGNPFASMSQYFKMYAPATIEPGSSVSHVDSGSPVAASELMRPFSSTFSPRNIGHTGAFMLDLGWGGQAFGTAGQPIHFGMTGLWYNPETSGQGFLVDIAATQDPPQATAFWFTFADQAGGPESQRWYTAQGDYSEGDTSVAMTVYMTTGGAFDRRPPVPETNPVGEMTLAFQSCDEATLSYDFELDNNPDKRVQGVVPVSRLSPDIYCETGMDPDDVPFIDPPPPVVLSPVLNGSWYESATSGQGLLFDVVEDQDPPQLVALWFTFAETAGGAQRQRWFLAQGDYTPGDREVTLDVRMSLGGEFDHRPPVPELVTVGTAELEFESCTEAEFEYDINLDNVPGEGTEGRIALRRLTPDILCHKGLR